MSFYPLDSPLTVGVADAGSTVPVKDAPAGQALLERQTKIFSRKDLLGIQSSFVTQMLERGIQSLCCIPLTTRKGELGTLNLASQDANAFAAKDIGFWSRWRRRWRWQKLPEVAALLIVMRRWRVWNGSTSSVCCVRPME